MNHATQVEYFARKAAIMGRASDIDDHRQDGWLGLLLAESRYDSSKAKLSTYAKHRIHGQIIDGIRRRHPFGPRASRSHRDIPIVSFDGPGAPEPLHRADPIDGILEAERASAVHRIIDSMPERYAAVLRMHYLEGITIFEIVRRTGLSRSTICKLHSEALDMFRRRWAVNR